MADAEDNIYKDLMAVFKKHMDQENDGDFKYINPNFLTETYELISTYGRIEDDDIHDWCYDMFGA